MALTVVVSSIATFFSFGGILIGGKSISIKFIPGFWESDATNSLGITASPRSRIAGILIDNLNNKVENLGYFGLLAIAGSCFILGPMATFLIKENINESISNKS